jgi:PAS domain S-box-containing protein
MMTILIVDDNEQNLYQLQVLLGGNGYQVVTATNGAEALEKARQAPPDLIITDILMPVMDGFTLCREWKKDERLRKIPLVFYTATYTDERDREFALGLGAARFMVKPEEPDVFIRTIRETIQQVANPPPAPTPPADTPTHLLIEAPEEEETFYLKQYNEVLIHRLEAKMEQLEHTNRELEKNIAERQRSAAALVTLNQEIQASRSAALNLMDDAVEARNRLETANQGLRSEIVERKRAEQALQENQDLLNEVGRIAKIGGWKMDLITREATWTQGTYSIVEIEPGQPIPGPDEHVDYYLPEYRPLVIEAMRALIEDDTLLDFEAQLRTVKGNVKWCRAIGRAVREGGKAVGVYGTFQDITERKRGEEALRASEERFRRALLNSPFPILLHAEDGMILQASNSWCEITGYTRAELATVGDWTERAYGERKKLVQADIDALYGMDHRKYEGDYSIRTKTGSTRIWEFSSAPLGRLPDGRRSVISMAMDVTERRGAESEVHRLNTELEKRVLDRTAELEAANKELEAFSYSVSHDLRAPLRAVDGFARILAEDHAEHLNEEGLRVLDTIRSEARRMDRLIDDMLAFARASRSPMRTDELDMSALARAVFNECAAQAPGRELRLHMDTLAPAQGDRAMIRQVLTNLIANAIKYTRPKPNSQIEISSRVEDRAIVYGVKDNGVGFDMKYVGKLFGIFQRLHAEDDFEGTGVGLALVQRIVHRHGGRVWAEGKVNEGAAFYFTLPAVEMKNGE